MKLHVGNANFKDSNGSCEGKKTHFSLSATDVKFLEKCCIKINVHILIDEIQVISVFQIPENTRRRILDYVSVKSTRKCQGKHFLYSESWLETRDKLGVPELWVLLLIIGNSAFG